MKINELLDQIPSGISIGDTDISVKDVIDFAKDNEIPVSTAIKMAKDAHRLANKTVTVPGIDKEYKVGDLISSGLDAATITAMLSPLGAARGVTMATLPTVAKTVAKNIVKKAAPRQAASQVVKAATGSVSFTPPKSAKVQDDPIKKKKKRSVGDLITIAVKGEKFKVPIISIEPNDYVVDLSSIPGRKKGDTARVPDREISESSSATVTSGNIASLGNSPHIAAGTPAVLKRWSGEPGSSGTTGKSIKHKPMKKQTASDNPITNPNVGNNLIA